VRTCVDGQPQQDTHVDGAFQLCRDRLFKIEERWYVSRVRRYLRGRGRTTSVGRVAGDALLAAVLLAGTMIFGAGCNGNPGGPLSGAGGSAGVPVGVGGAGGAAGAGGAVLPGTGGAGTDAGNGDVSTTDSNGDAPDAPLGDAADGAANVDTAPVPDAANDPPTCITSISGTVYDPAGKLPVYNAFVYAPTTTLDPVAPNVSCDRCAVALSGAPSAVTRSDALGHFKLTGLPSGANVPIVIQIGKWRRPVTIPTVAPCSDTAITDVNLTRLPRTSAEGHLPKIAVTTGLADALECLLRKIGIDDSEFTTDAGAGRVNMFAGGDGVAGSGATTFSAALGGATFPAATQLWGNPTKLMGYDMMIMSCEGGQFATQKMPNVGNMKAFADAGGRIIADHLHYYWLRNGPVPWPTTAVYLDPQPDLPDPTPATVNASFAGGAALADELLAVGASQTRGALTLYGAQSAVASVIAPTTSWMTIANPAANVLFTFDTPVEAAPSSQCGRVAFVDLHVKSTVSTQNGKDTSNPNVPFPGGCLSTILTAQEQAVEFMLFETGSCLE
jgi:hypothetical protein